jgi:RNA polymerase sigma factor (sigma-70 family)
MSFPSLHRHTPYELPTDQLRPLDEEAFGARVEPHRRELHVHCYRLLSLFEEAEDLVQEAFLRAWCRRETYEGRSSVRAWLYRIATNACLDALDKRPRRPSSKGEITWLQPYPDELLEQLPDRREGPKEVALARKPLSWRPSLRSSTSRRCLVPCSCSATSSAARRRRRRDCWRRRKRR